MVKLTATIAICHVIVASCATYDCRKRIHRGESPVQVSVRVTCYSFAFVLCAASDNHTITDIGYLSR